MTLSPVLAMKPLLVNMRKLIALMTIEINSVGPASQNCQHFASVRKLSLDTLGIRRI